MEGEPMEGGSSSKLTKRKAVEETSLSSKRAKLLSGLRGSLDRVIHDCSMLEGIDSPEFKKLGEKIENQEARAKDELVDRISSLKKSISSWSEPMLEVGEAIPSPESELQGSVTQLAHRALEAISSPERDTPEVAKEAEALETVAKEAEALETVSSPKMQTPEVTKGEALETTSESPTLVAKGEDDTSLKTKTPTVDEEPTHLAKQEEDDDEEDYAAPFVFGDDDQEGFACGIKLRCKYEMSPEDPEIIEVANIALDEYNDDHDTDYELENVISGSREFYSGYEYFLYFAASHHLYKSVKVTSLFFAHYLDFISEKKRFAALEVTRPFYQVKDGEQTLVPDADDNGDVDDNGNKDGGKEEATDLEVATRT